MLKKIKAHWKCFFYLLFIGMWQGECEYIITIKGKMIFLASATGSILDEDLQIKKIFYSGDNYIISCTYDWVRYSKKKSEWVFSFIKNMVNFLRGKNGYI